MTDPIIVPVSAPGATEASAQVRTFAGTVAQAGAASEKAAAGHAGVAKATRAAGDAAGAAAVKNQAHIRTLDEEYARLKRQEEQLLVTAAARKRLGESYNAADIGAIRRFTRGLPGGVGREAGRGIAEGIEGAEGGGLRSTLGLAGAGVAAGAIGFEAVSHAVEMLVEVMHRETEERFKNIALIQEADKRVGDLGKSALDKYGPALANIAAGGGETAVRAAKDFAGRNNDATGIEAYESLSQHFDPGTERGLALQAAEMFHKAGGGSLKDAAGKLTPERIARMLAGGTSMSSMVGEMFGDDRGMGRLSADDVEKRVANQRGSGTAANIDRLLGLENSNELANLDKIPQAEGGIRKQRADEANERAAMLHDLDVKRRAERENQRKDAELEENIINPGGIFDKVSFLKYIPNAVTLARGLYLGGKKALGQGTASDRLGRSAGEDYDTAEALMPGTEEAAGALEDAAAALRALGRGRQTAGATP